MLAEGVRPIYASGECEIDLARRELRVRGLPVPVGGRAFEIIEVLAQSAGQVVTKDELMNRVWPGAIVMDGTLHVHAAAVRRALGPYRSLLKTEARRGYRLLGDWIVQRHDTRALPAFASRRRVEGESRSSNFPAAITALVGRSAAMRKLHDLVSAYRVVTLTGPGGIGKTSLALKVARRVLSEFDDGGWLVELASLSDPKLVPSAVAGALGLNLGSDVNCAEAVARAIGGKRILVVLDNCEHVIDAAATLVETFVRLCPRAMILAASREIFRIEGEYVYRVPALDVPLNDQIDAEQILRHSAPAFFIARAAELGSDFSSCGEMLPTIAAICRHLDGIPLAIEFAAAQAATLGIEQVAAGLRDRFALLKNARRNALPRHRTLRAALDWSYDLLPDSERLLLQRLAVFSGSFSLAAANAVSNADGAPEVEITDGVANLVAKSLVSSDFAGGSGHFYLLETTRDYAYSRLIERGTAQTFARRHAEYYRGLLERMGHERERRATPSAVVDNVRAALEWCFGTNGDVAVGIGLAAAAAPVFMTISLLPECYRWSEEAISALDAASWGGAEEMHLQASLGASSMDMFGQSEPARVALDRSLCIAQARGDARYQAELVSSLTMFHTRAGDFKTALHYARLGQTVAGVAAEPTTVALAQSILGRSLHFMGDHSGARSAFEASLQYWSGSPGTSEIHLGVDHHVWVGVGLARTLWLQGHPVQAAERMRQTIRDAERRDQPASLGFALFWAPGIFLWVGDLRDAEAHADRLISHGETHFQRPYMAAGRGYKGALAIARGDAGAGVEDLQGCLGQFQAMHYRMLNTEFKLLLVQGLIATGLFDEALALVDETIRLVEANGDLIHMPEALRARGRVLLCWPKSRADEAERCFVESLDWSRRQGARSWELRAAVDFASLWAAQGQQDRARAVLRPIFATFEEGFDTVDLRAAEHLLGTLR